MLAGCAKQSDSLTFIHEESGMPHNERASYEVNIGHEVVGGAVVAELWESGQCVQSAPLTFNGETERIGLSITVDGHGTTDGSRGLSVQMDTNEASNSVLTYFELPQNVSGYSFSAYEDGEIIHIAAGEERLLGAMAFDTGAGVRVPDCESLMDDPERIKEYSFILILRASFAAGEIGSQGEAAAGGA